VLFGRYHLRILRTPREVRNALAYVLLNARKHWVQRFGQAPPVRLDEASSWRWFDGWRREAPAGAPPRPDDPIEVAAPRTWLLSRGWRRHGLVDPAEVPVAARRRSSRQTGFRGGQGDPAQREREGAPEAGGRQIAEAPSPASVPESRRGLRSRIARCLPPGSAMREVRLPRPSKPSSRPSCASLAHTRA